MTTPLSDRDAFRLSIRYDAPDFVKDADVDDALGLDPDRNPLYADAVGKRYAVHTKAATWMSLAAAVDAGLAGRPEWDAINNACEFFALGAERDRLLAKKAALDESAAAAEPDAWYGWVEKAADGSVERRIRLADAGEIKAAAAWLLDHRDELPYADRQRIAERVLARAASEAADLGPRGPGIDKMAGFGRSPDDDAIHAVVARAAAIRTKRAEEAAALDELAESLASTPGSLGTREARIKLARVLDDVDRGFHLTRRYAEGTLKRPEEAVFGVTEADGAAVLAKYAAVEPGSLYDRAVLEATPAAEIAARLGGELAARLTADGVFLDAGKIASDQIDDAERALIARALADAGVTPLK